MYMYRAHKNIHLSHVYRGCNNFQIALYVIVAIVVFATVYLISVIDSYLNWETALVSDETVTNIQSYLTSDITTSCSKYTGKTICTNDSCVRRVRR